MESVVEKIVLILRKFSYVNIDIFVMWTLFVISQLRLIDWHCICSSWMKRNHSGIANRILQCGESRKSTLRGSVPRMRLRSLSVYVILNVDCLSTNAEIRKQRYSS